MTLKAQVDFLLGGRAYRPGDPVPSEPADRIKRLIANGAIAADRPAETADKPKPRPETADTPPEVGPKVKRRLSTKTGSGAIPPDKR